jgi:hypothetical protein
MIILDFLFTTEVKFFYGAGGCAEVWAPSSYHEFMYKGIQCGIVSLRNEPWKGRRTYFFLGF